MELIIAKSQPLIVENGFALIVYSDGNGAVSLGIESVGSKKCNGTASLDNFEPIRDALAYMMEHPGEDNNLASVAENLGIVLHRDDGEVVQVQSGILFNAAQKNFYFVGVGCDSPYIELFYNFMEEHLSKAMNRVSGQSVALPDKPLPSGFDQVEEDERFLKAIPHHKPRKDMRLRSAFDYVSSGVFVFAYTREEEKYIHYFAKITGISDVAIRDGMYEFYPYVTIRDRVMVPVRLINWDNVISCRAMLKKMHEECTDVFTESARIVQ